MDEVNIVKAQLQSNDNRCCRGAAVRMRRRCFLTAEQPTSRALGDEERYAFSKIIYDANSATVPCPVT